MPHTEPRLGEGAPGRLKLGLQFPQNPQSWACPSPRARRRGPSAAQGREEKRSGVTLHTAQRSSHWPHGHLNSIELQFKQVRNTVSSVAAATFEGIPNHSTAGGYHNGWCTPRRHPSVTTYWTTPIYLSSYLSPSPQGPDCPQPLKEYRPDLEHRTPGEGSSRRPRGGVRGASPQKADTLSSPTAAAHPRERWAAGWGRGTQASRGRRDPWPQPGPEGPACSPGRGGVRVSKQPELEF